MVVSCPHAMLSVRSSDGSRLDIGASGQTTTASVTNGKELFGPNPSVLEYQPLTIWSAENDTKWISQFVLEPASQQ